MTTEASRSLRAVTVMSVAAVGMYFVRSVVFSSNEYWYLNWNLVLAWMPLLFAWLLVTYTHKNPWVSWKGVGLTVLWLGFLPNSFYIATDLIHLQSSLDKTLLFDVVLLLLFTLSGFVLGYLSVFLVHTLLLKRMGKTAAAQVIGAIFGLCSFAIYLGRFLRWNTWDVITNPAGLIVDISDRIINPVAHEQTFWVTILLFTLLGTIYFVIWQFIDALRSTRTR
jgi:uncharacterized membrane protein